MICTLAIILTFSLANLAISSLLLILMMSFSTLFILSNSYRVKTFVTDSFAPAQQPLRNLIISDIPFYTLMIGHGLFMTSLLSLIASNGIFSVPFILTGVHSL